MSIACNSRERKYYEIWRVDVETFKRKRKMENARTASKYELCIIIHNSILPIFFLFIRIYCRLATSYIIMTFKFLLALG